MTLARDEAKPALLSFEDDQRLICNLRDESTRLKKKVRCIATLLIFFFR